MNFLKIRSLNAYVDIKYYVIMLLNLIFFNHKIKILRGTKKPIIKAVFRVLLLKNQFFVIRKSKKLCSIDVLSFKYLLIAQNI